MQVQTHIQILENIEKTARLVMFDTSILSYVRCESFHMRRGLLYK